MTLKKINQVLAVITATAIRYDVTLTEIEGRSRKWDVVWPRWCAMAIVRNSLNVRACITASVFNRTEHLINHAVKRHGEIIARDPKLRDEFNELKKLLKL